MPGLEPEKRGGKARLLEAALVLAQERPFDEITIEEIIQQARLSRPAFYYHFAGGKEELRQALVERGVLSETPAQDVHQNVIQAALRIYARSGISAATLEDIAAEAGITKSALCWHFRSKEDLLIAVLKEYGPPSSLKQTMERIKLELQNAPLSDYKMIFRRLAETFYEAFNVQGDYARLAMLLVYTHPDMAQVLSEKIVNGRKVFTEYVRTLQDEGYFRRDIDPSFLTQIMATVFAMRAIGRGLYNQLPDHSLSREDMVEQLVSLLLYGIVRGESAVRKNEE